MLCGQVIRAVLSDPDDPTRITLVFSNRNEADMLLRTEVGAG